MSRFIILQEADGYIIKDSMSDSITIHTVFVKYEQAQAVIEQLNKEEAA